MKKRLSNSNENVDERKETQLNDDASTRDDEEEEGKDLISISTKVVVLVQYSILCLSTVVARAKSRKKKRQWGESG